MEERVNDSIQMLLSLHMSIKATGADSATINDEEILLLVEVLKDCKKRMAL